MSATAPAGAGDAAPGAPVHVLLFHVGPRVFASDVRDVVRIEADRRSLASAVPESCLGRSAVALRGLVVRTDAGEATLAVDGILGIREPGARDVHALPALAAAFVSSRAVRGLVVLDEVPMPLIDLPLLLGELQAQSGAPRPGEVPHA